MAIELIEERIDYSDPESYAKCVAIAKDESRDTSDRCDLLFTISQIATQPDVKVLPQPEVVLELEDLALRDFNVDPSIREAALSAYKYVGDLYRSKPTLLNFLTNEEEPSSLRYYALKALSHLSRSDPASSREFVKTVFQLDPNHPSFPMGAFLDEIWDHLKKEDRWDCLKFYHRSPPVLQAGFVQAARAECLPGINTIVKVLGLISRTPIVRYAAWVGEIY